VTDATPPADADPSRHLPPLSGGTLLVTRDGAFAVASNPDVDQVFVVGISGDAPGCEGCDEAPKLLAAVPLAEGEEPGRIAEDAYGRAHVVLRRGDAIASIDVASGELLARRPVCPAPRGIAYDAAEDRLHVACASGKLVSLSPLTGEVTRQLDLDVDLRDVVVVPTGLVVSRFKKAELLRLDAEGRVVDRVVPTGIVRGPQTLSDLTSDPMDPAVAWRTIGTPGGDVLMLHQYGLARPIDIGEDDATAAPPTPYAASATSPCGGIVSQTVSTLSSAGSLDMGMPMPVRALSVDVAASPDGAWVAVAHPGATSDRVTVYASGNLPSQGRSPVRCADDAGRLIVTGQPVAVATHPNRAPGATAAADWLVVQTRSPDTLAFYREFAAARVSVPLIPEGGFVRASIEATGRGLFHLDSGGGIACAQCHPEGGDDGRVWEFSPLGRRRTQAPQAGLADSAPYHWEGDLADVSALVDEVYVRRMGGIRPSDSKLLSLQRWLFSLTPPSPIVDPASPAATRGRALFESDAVGCQTCHDGGGVATTDDVDVGVESPLTFQIPPLRGVGYRGPFLHDGCAATLRDRFTAPCGGDDRHGHTSQLAPEEIDDLVAYLKSL
jgi:hypothetical protein